MVNDAQQPTARPVLVMRSPARRMIANGRYYTKGSPREGGLASVYRAMDTELDRPVALKVFRKMSGTDDVVEESFRCEVQALSDLRHHSIVEIFDSGIDSETGEHYIAMEWADQDLTTATAAKPYASWDEFFVAVGGQVLDALVFAHSRATAHRDIKPSNILLSNTGEMKVCDFGISKIRNFFAPGVTLAQFGSKPFSPPEEDDGTYSYSRDVFGFAVLAIASLSSSPTDNYQDVAAALEQLEMDEPLRRVLRRCVSITAPADRPQNAILLRGELERLRPKLASSHKGSILISLTRKVRAIVSIDINLNSDVLIDKFVLSDLEDVCAELAKENLNGRQEGQQALGRDIQLHGDRYSYIAIVEAPSGQRLKLVSARDRTTSEIERMRDRALPCEYRFQLVGVAAAASGDSIESFQDQLAEFNADQKVLQAEQREQALYRKWLDLLSASTELEQQRKVKLRYAKLEPAGASVRFQLAPGSDASQLADKDVRVELPSGEVFQAAVVSVGDGHILAQPTMRNRVNAEALPESGSLEVDTTKADAALDKQKTAIDAVRYGRSVNPDLGVCLTLPADISVPSVVEVEFIQQRMDDDKRDAVRAALSEPALLLVQGPPGTGKTTFITELVLQTLRRTPGARILLTSQTHVALDNSLERILKESSGAVTAVRIGDETDDRIAESTKNLLIENKLPGMRKQAIASGKDFIEAWASARLVPIRDTRMAMALERHAGFRSRIEYVEEQIDLLQPQTSDTGRKTLGAEQRAEIDEQFDALTKERNDLLRRLDESMAELRKHEDDSDHIKHFAICSADELGTWADTYAPKTQDGAELKKMLAAHADWETRFGRSWEFRAALIAASQVVAGTCLGVMSIPGRKTITYDLCIVDEASIATPTQVLVPMARARRTVLVGDNRQLSPFQDPELKSSGLLERYGLTREDQRATLFSHLNDSLPAELKKTLSTQHRMLPAIGNLISECFYDGELRSVERDPAAFLAGAMPKPVVWYSTSRKPNRASKTINTSHYNDGETQYIVTLLSRVDFSMRNGKGKGKKISIAVLTGYGEQKRRLRSAIDGKKRDWVSFSDVYVNVVDAFQGREADMLIFSITRSDAKGLGFLREMERINVALSRGKELLAIVGDHAFCQQADDRSNPLKGVIDYIRRNPQDCLLEELPA